MQSFTDLRTGSVVEVPRTGYLKHQVFVFVSSSCPCSTSHTDLLNEVADQYSSKGFEFYGLHPNFSEDKEEAKAFYRTSYRFPVLDDSAQVLTKELKAIKTPQAFVISPKGETLYLGAVSNSRDARESTENYLAAALDQIVSGQRPNPKMRKALGCAIER